MSNTVDLGYDWEICSADHYRDRALAAEDERHRLAIRNIERQHEMSVAAANVKLANRNVKAAYGG